MKKPYKKPEIYSEDVSIAFAQNCCAGIESPSGINEFAGLWCSSCRIETTYEYVKC